MKYSKENNLPHLRSAAQALHDENTRLRAAMAELEARLGVAETEAATARAEKERLEQEIKLLREQLDKRTRELYGRKTERRKKDGSSGETSAEKAEKKPRKKQKGHGTTPQPDLPVEEVKNMLADEARDCRHCGGHLEPMGCGDEISELIAIDARRIVLERHIREKYRCPGCQTGVVTAPGPVKLIPGGRYALNFAVEVAYSKYFAHLPLERQVQIMKHEGLRVTTATLFDQIDALATTLTPTYQAIWAQLQSESVLRADETPWNVLSNGYTANERFYAWCAVGENLIAYRLLDTRSAEGAATILGAFAGTLMVDGLTSYPAAAKGAPGEAPRFKVANCHAHARRKFVDCEKHYPEESQHAIELYRRLYDVEREAKASDADRLALRQSKSRMLIDELFDWARFQQAREDILPSSGLKKAVNYLLNHEEGLRVFLDDPAVPIDNNESERAMRAPVIGRKNSYGSRSRRGTETAAILYTLVESAKRVGVPPKEYLEAAAEHALRRAGAVLMPDEFKQQLEAAHPENNDST